MSVRPSNASVALTGWLGRIRERLERGRTVESSLWAVALVAMLLDVVSTDYGLAMGLSEVNPLGRMALDAFGSVGLFLAKLPVLVLATVGWWLLPETERWAVPLGLAVPWGTAVALNLSVTAIPPADCKERPSVRRRSLGEFRPSLGEFRPSPVERGDGSSGSVYGSRTVQTTPP